LDLQSGDVESQLAKEKLSEGQSRISSMSLIHQKLYQTEYLEDLDFQEYTEQLVELILKSANKLKNTKLNISTNGLKLDIDTAIPLGLILNELCTNSCKYAFSDSNQNTLDITIVKQDESFYKLTYSDSGTNEIIDSTSKPKGIGMLLIKSLTKQLQGKSSYTFNSGAHFEILFKNRNQRKEIE
jgi:two-component sensor histidine kinase